jgi:hypothetical protein
MARTPMVYLFRRHYKPGRDGIRSRDHQYVLIPRQRSSLYASIQTQLSSIYHRIWWSIAEGAVKTGFAHSPNESIWNATYLLLIDESCIRVLSLRHLVYFHVYFTVGMDHGAECHCWTIDGCCRARGLVGIVDGILLEMYYVIIHYLSWYRSESDRINSTKNLTITKLDAHTMKRKKINLCSLSLRPPFDLPPIRRGSI